VYVVEGKFLVQDQPASNASVALHPVQSKSSNLICPVGITQADGSFRLTSFNLHDGAPAGEYVATVLWHDPSRPVDECECIKLADHDLLYGKYLDAETSALRVTVLPRQNQITLSATPGDPPSQKPSFRRARTPILGTP